MGGNKSFLYGYEPAYLETDGCGWGNNILFGLDDDGKIKYRTAAYYGMQMLTHYWLQPANSPLEIYTAECTFENMEKQPLITAYAIHKPGDTWSLMLINKDPRIYWNVDADIKNITLNTCLEFHPSQIIQYSKAQYHWVHNGSKGHPSLQLPPVIKNINGRCNFSLPPLSLTIIN